MERNNIRNEGSTRRSVLKSIASGTAALGLLGAGSTTVSAQDDDDDIMTGQAALPDERDMCTETEGYNCVDRNAGGPCAGECCPEGQVPTVVNPHSSGVGCTCSPEESISDYLFFW